MKRALAVIVGAAAVTAVVATSGQADPPTTLHLIGKQITEHVPKGGPRPGDAIVFTGKETGDDSGHSYVACTLVDRIHGLCAAHFQLAKGTIAVATAIPLEDSPKTITLEITGGTGAYDGVRGTARFTDIGKDKTDEVFAFAR